MKKCESWAVAAAYLMQSQNDKEHYTNIAKYILETNLTTLAEKGATASQAIGEMLRQLVIDGQAIFNSEGNGYYSLKNESAIRKFEEVQYAIQCLKSKKPNIDTLMMEEETVRLREENKKLREENKKLREEIQPLKEKLQSIKRLCK